MATSSSTTMELATTTIALVGEAGQLLSTAITLPEASTHKADSASILDAPHLSPVRYNPKDPIVLFCVQAGIIIILTRFLAVFLGKLRQPKVISEVIGGILLGPSVCGRIPGFTDNIFPSASLPYLNLVATIGLVLFLFLVGLESDFSVFKRNARRSITIAVASLIVPFGLGAAVSVGLFNTFIQEDEKNVSFGHFLLFCAVAMAITAFPVLSRILTELHLLQTNVGACVLAAGVANDVCGWILLALAIALVNAGSGVSAVYVLLCAVGWVLILIYIARPFLVWVARKTGSFESGPTNLMMVMTILIIFTSAFVTSIIGIHPIFGGFCAGVIMPQPKRFVQQLTEKVEDLVSVLFLPIYFALSGLRTNLGLLNDGSIWGYAVCVIVVAFSSKFLSSGIAAKMTGFNWRESAAVGSLMACKGLVELIVLNIGLDAGILNNQIFAMFVLMALITTFATTPLVLLFYPAHCRDASGKGQKEAQGDQSTATKEDHKKSSSDGATHDITESHVRQRFVVVLNRLEHLPSIMAVTKLLHKPLDYDKQEKDTSTPVHIDALRLLELTDRTSAVQRAANLSETAAQDPLRNIYATFAGLNGFDVVPTMVVTSASEFPSTVVAFTQEKRADMVILPWGSAAQNHVEAFSHSDEASSGGPFEALFKPSSPTTGIADSPLHAHFIKRVFAEAQTDVGLFLDRMSFGSAPAIPAGRQHIFLPFLGGQDDRLALELVIQLCRHPGVTASCVQIVTTTTTEQGGSSSGPDPSTPGASPTVAHRDSLDKKFSVTENAQTASLDNVAWSHLFDESNAVHHSISTLQALARISTTRVETDSPLREMLKQLRSSADGHPHPVMVLVGRNRRSSRQSSELDQILKEHLAERGPAALGVVSDSDVRRTIGALGSAVIVSGLAGSLMVVQAGERMNSPYSRRRSLIV